MRPADPPARPPAPRPPGTTPGAPQPPPPQPPQPQPPQPGTTPGAPQPPPPQPHPPQPPQPGKTPRAPQPPPPQPPQPGTAPGASGHGRRTAGWRGDPEARRRPPISVGDLLRATQVLDTDDAMVAAVAALLGLTPAAGAGRPVRRTATEPPRPPTPTWHPREEVAGREGEGVRPAGDDPRPARRPRLLAEPGPPAVPPRPLRGSVEQLLPALVAVPRPGREVDVDALVDRVASRQPIDAVPRLPEATTRLGVQLLADQGPSMRPYLRDLRLLADALRQVAGADAVEVLAADGDLDAVVPLTGEGTGERPYAPPAGARPVLLASDLGIGTPPDASPPVTEERWLDLARLAREAGAPLVVLVPYPPTRWPAWTAGKLTLVHWDRPTDASQARRAARHAAARAGVRT